MAERFGLRFCIAQQNALYPSTCGRILRVVTELSWAVGGKTPGLPERSRSADRWMKTILTRNASKEKKKSPAVAFTCGLKMVKKLNRILIQHDLGIVNRLVLACGYREVLACF